MKAVVTGGAGFIGSHLTEKLLEKGWDVCVLDDLSTGRAENIAHLLGRNNFEFVKGSILEADVVEGLIEKADVVFHLAAAVGVRLIVDDPVNTIETNIRGTEIVLAAANRFSKKIFIASSSEVYGKGGNVPFREDDDTLLGATVYPRWSYAASKAVDEFLALAYYKQFGLGVIIGRFFNTVGPRQIGQYGMVVPRFVQAALQGEPITVYGSGKQSRCFCHVFDVVRAVIGLMECEKAAGRVYNIGSSEEVSIEGLADKVIALTGSSSEKKYVSYEQAYGRDFDDMARRVPSLERIKQTVGFEPEYDLRTTLESVIEHFREG